MCRGANDWASERASILSLPAVLAASLACLAWPTTARAQPRKPVYVGAKVCATCHDGPNMGHQATLWMGTRHAKAYASLATPEARSIAAISGVPIEPQRSPLCLGCHATGSDAEPAEKDDTFSLRDGVQCEKCHGPGSEHVESWAPGKDGSARIALTNPLPADCMNCHKEKPSHTRILPAKPRRPNRAETPFDLMAALKAVSHPTPKDAKPVAMQPPPFPTREGAGASYIGSHACAECHDAAEKGSQFCKWRDTPHARAYAALGTPHAKNVALEKGINDDPQMSTECLKCHATAYHRDSAGAAETYSVLEGVGCEACHGPGSEHATAAAELKERPRTFKTGLLATSSETCTSCHDENRGKPFAHEEALKAIAHPARPPAVSREARYKTPLRLAFRPGGREVYVTCEASATVCVLDSKSMTKVAEIPVGGQPTDVTFSPDGSRAYVTNRLDDSLSVIDATARRVTATVPVGDEPHGVRTDASGRTLYVVNTASDDISVLDAKTLRERKRLSASRSPWSIALSPDGGRMLVTNALSRFVPFREPSVSEITAVDASREVVDDRHAAPGANMLLGIAWHPSGEFALATLERTKNLVPMTRMTQGWTVTNGLAVIGADGQVDQVLLDDPGESFPDPTDVAFTPDGTLALVTSSGSDRVALVDVARLRKVIAVATPREREDVLPNHLGKASEFVIGRIATGINPRGLAVAPDGKTAWVACALEDAVAVIDIAARKEVRRVDLGGPKEISRARFGERLFNNAGIALRRQLSCHTCHPDGHVDGLTYDIEADGIGTAPVDNRTLRGILDTGPFKWNGGNATLSRQCGPRLSVYFTRIQPYTSEELEAVDHYISTIPRPPNRYRPLGAELTPAQRRGKAIFERTATNDGRPIRKQNRCATCHFPPLYTDRERHDIGSKMAPDIDDKVDVPHLNNIYDSAPYMHNGIAATLEEIWTVYNPRDTHGVTNDMTKDQLNDLIEYLKTL
ncbi:Cytochrome c-554 precursor [Aquisphaera giovannonii]|uniref:Cytochrome c-554 n=1 Tax=Aquisphaera giovannonii TaxID=406548 RepID=A0A5B9W9E8_9BACT|nr:multiheme c-type cytochrome [Aquisphaera giovannonii]QEH36450.1 Cytochrome c-554 precursor [Aquisphaera giovannonii]